MEIIHLCDDSGITKKGKFLKISKFRKDFFKGKLWKCDEKM